MDVVTPSILGGLVSRGLGAFTTSVRRSARQARTKKLEDRLDFASRDASNQIIKIVVDLSDTLSGTDMQKVCNYLQSTEADFFVRSLALSILTKEYQQIEFDLRVQLEATLCLQHAIDAQLAQRLADRLVITIASVIKTAASDYEMQAPYEYSLAVDRAQDEKNAGHLRILSQQAQFFRRKTPQDFANFLEFSKKYRTQLRKQTAELVPAYFDIQRRVPIDHIYVEPRLCRTPTPSSDDPIITFQGFVDFGFHRSVVLGDPGAGKSTLAQKLAYDLADDGAQTYRGIGQLPFIVPVRFYESRKRGQQLSIARFIEQSISENLHIDPPPETLDYFLLTGRAVVIFDGLDELLDLSRRREVCSAIESFSTLYATSQIIATSRRLGYEEAPLNPDVYTKYYLQNFTDEDVQSYAHAWFSIDNRLSASEGQQVAAAFYRESLTVQDLRRNALMLGLMCNLYRGIRTIPQNRAELYEQCARMMFERWDAGRGIVKSGLLKSDARTALQDVALWIYMDDSLAAGVSEKKLRARLTAYWSRRYESEGSARDAADELLDLWRGRSWIISDVGTIPSTRQVIYKFTHQTFLEYFASVELSRLCPTPVQLWNALAPRLEVGSWEIVGQLAIQKLNDAYFDAADEVIKLLISAASAKNMPEQFNLIAFASRNLDALYVTPATCRKLTGLAVDLALRGLSDVPSFLLRYFTKDKRSSNAGRYTDDDEQELGNEESNEDEDAYEKRNRSRHEDWNGSDDEEDTGRSYASSERTFSMAQLFEPLSHLLALDFELGRVARDEVFRHCRLLFRDGTSTQRARALLLTADWEIIPMFATDGSEVPPETPHKRLSKLTGGNLSVLRDQIYRLSSVNFWVPIVAGRHGVISPEEIVQSAGPIGLFCNIGPFEEGKHGTFAEMMLRCYFGLERAERGHEKAFKKSDVRAALRLLSDLSENESPAFIHALADSRTSLFDDLLVKDPMGGGHGPQLRPESDWDVMYGASVLLATFIELEQWQIWDHATDQPIPLRLGPLQQLYTVFCSRTVPGLEDEASVALRRTGLGERQLRILEQWARSEIDFI